MCKIGRNFIAVQRDRERDGMISIYLNVMGERDLIEIHLYIMQSLLPFHKKKSYMALGLTQQYDNV